MKLEMRKFRLTSYMLAAMAANVIILAAFCAICNIPEIRDELSLTTYSTAFIIMDTLVRATYIVFAAVLLSKLVIDEFRSKSITLLFMYPINRKKLIASKLLIVVLFTLIADIVANLFVGFGFYISNTFMTVVTEPFTWSIAIKSLLRVVMSALATSFLSLIPLYFGMIKHSVSATIVSSLLVVALVCQTVDDFTMYSIIAIPICLALLGVSIAYLAIRNIDRTDVLH